MTDETKFTDDTYAVLDDRAKAFLTMLALDSLPYGEKSEATRQQDDRLQVAYDIAALAEYVRETVGPITIAESVFESDLTDKQLQEIRQSLANVKKEIDTNV